LFNVVILQAYICSFVPKPGKLDVEKCLDCGVPPGPLLGQLHTIYSSPFLLYYQLSLCQIFAPVVICDITTSVADPDPPPGWEKNPESGMNIPDAFSESLETVFSSVRIRILLSSSKNSKKNLDSYCFATSFGVFIFEK
jgi:hypothetical protein